jgi:hypothetical protein
MHALWLVLGPQFATDRKLLEISGGGRHQPKQLKQLKHVQLSPPNPTIVGPGCATTELFLSALLLPPVQPQCGDQGQEAACV